MNFQNLLFTNDLFATTLLASVLRVYALTLACVVVLWGMRCDLPSKNTGAPPPSFHPIITPLTYLYPTTILFLPLPPYYTHQATTTHHHLSTYLPSPPIFLSISIYLVFYPPPPHLDNQSRQTVFVARILVLVVVLSLAFLYPFRSFILNYFTSFYLKILFL